MAEKKAAAKKAPAKAAEPDDDDLTTPVTDDSRPDQAYRDEQLGSRLANVKRDYDPE